MFLQKFKKGNQDLQPPPGINLEYSSFAQNQSNQHYDSSVVEKAAQSSNQSQNNNNQNTSQYQSTENQLQLDGRKTSQQQMQTKTGKPGGGWEDDEEDYINSQQQQIQQNPQMQQEAQKKKLMDKFRRPTQQQQQQQQGELIEQRSDFHMPQSASEEEKNRIQVPDYNKVERQNFPILLKSEKKQSFEQNINEFAILTSENLDVIAQFEQRLVKALVQPGGIRLKQPEHQLQEFVKVCESLKVYVIGSVLINLLNADYAIVTAQTKVRTIFGIEALVRQNAKYCQYFKTNWQTIQNVMSLTEPEGVGGIVHKHLDYLEKVIQDPKWMPNVEKQDVQFQFKDNGLANAGSSNKKNSQDLLQIQENLKQPLTEIVTLNLGTEGRTGTLMKTMSQQEQSYETSNEQRGIGVGGGQAHSKGSFDVSSSKSNEEQHKKKSAFDFLKNKNPATTTQHQQSQQQLQTQQTQQADKVERTDRVEIGQTSLIDQQLKQLDLTQQQIPKQGTPQQQGVLNSGGGGVGSEDQNRKYSNSGKQVPLPLNQQSSGGNQQLNTSNKGKYQAFDQLLGNSVPITVPVQGAFTGTYGIYPQQQQPLPAYQPQVGNQQQYFPQVSQFSIAQGGKAIPLPSAITIQDPNSGPTFIQLGQPYYIPPPNVGLASELDQEITLEEMDNEKNQKRKKSEKQVKAEQAFDFIKI